MGNKNIPEIRFKGFSDPWEQRKLNEMIINLDSGVSVNSSDENTGYYILKTSAIKSGNVDLTEVKSILREEIIRAKMPVIKGSILISRMNTPELVGASGLVLEDRENIFLPDRLWQGRVNDNFSSEWLIQSLNTTSSIRKIHDLATGTSGSMKNISKKVMLNFELKVPKLGEQQKIGAFFEQLDDAITLHQRKLDKLKYLKKSYLQKMFPRNGETKPELRFDGFTDAWEQRKLGDFVIKAVDNRGKTPPTQEFGRYPLLEVASLGKASPDYTKVTKYVDEETYNGWFRAHIKKDDILFSTVGNTGLVTLMDDYAGATIAQNIVAFRAIEGNNPQFLVQMFQLPENLKRAKRIEMGAVQPSIKVSQLIQVSYLLPNSEQEQEKIGLFFKQVDTTITLHQRKLDKLKLLKKFYLQKMFV